MEFAILNNKEQMIKDVIVVTLLITRNMFQNLLLYFILGVGKDEIPRT